MLALMNGLLRWRSLALFPVALAVLGSAHILVRTSSHGVAIGADSITFLSTAENLIAGQGAQDYRGVALQRRPLGFSLLLAAIGIIAEVEPSEAVRMVNAAAFGLTVLLAGLWLRRTLRSRLLTVGTTLVVATSHYLSHFASYAMAETTFILFALFATIRMESFLNRSVKWSSLVLVATFSGLATITRYAGVSVILTGAILLLARRETQFLSRLKLTTAYSVLSAAPLAVLLMRNKFTFGAWERAPVITGQSVFDSMHQIARVAERAVIPENAPDWVAPLLWVAVVLLALASAAICVRLAFRDGLGRSDVSPAVPIGTFFLVYLIFIVTVIPRASGTHFGNDPRYLLPLYIPLLLLVAFFLDRFLGLRTAGWMSAAKRMATAAILLCGLANVILTVQTNVYLTILALEPGYKGESYNTEHWDASETIRWLKENAGEAPCFGNRFGLLHARFGLETGTVVRGKYLNLPGNMELLTRWLEAAPDDALVVWLHDGEDWYEYGAQNLRSLPGLTVAAELSDGVIFRVTERDQRRL